MHFYLYIHYAKKEIRRTVLISNMSKDQLLLLSSRQWVPWNCRPSLVGQVNSCWAILTDYCHILVPYNTYNQFFTSSDSFNLCSIILEVRQSKLDAGVPFITSTFKKHSWFSCLLLSNRMTFLLSYLSCRISPPLLIIISFPNKEKVNRLKLLLTLIQIVLVNAQDFS